MIKTFQDEPLFGFSNFGHWDLFDIWALIFGISKSQLTSNKANSFRGDTKVWLSGQESLQVKYSVNEDTENSNRQYHGENQLFGIELFHESSGLIFFIQSEGGMKHAYCKLGIFLFDDAGNPNF